MKKNKTINKITLPLLSLLILTYSTVLQFSIPSIVLCFGDDGHIAFEQSEEDFPCTDSGDHDAHLANNHKVLSGQDDDCEDIPLINLFSTPFVEKDGKSKNVRTTLIDIYTKTINDNSVQNLDFKKVTTIIHFSRKSLQSTILLI